MHVTVRTPYRLRTLLLHLAAPLALFCAAGSAACASTPDQLSAGIVPNLILDATPAAGIGMVDVDDADDSVSGIAADPSSPAADAVAQMGETSATSTGLRSRVVAVARSWLGTRYLWGGESPEEGGFDCSGLVRFVFHQTTGLLLPRTAREQIQTGKTIDQGELKPGDLVFFKTTRRNLTSHVGIYIGNNEFLHAPSRGSEIRIDNMGNSYWSQRFAGARRLITAKTLALLPALK